MSTWTETVTYIKSQLRPGVLGNTNVQKILNAVLAVIQQINAGDFSPTPSAIWKVDVTYAADIQPVLWQDQWLVSNVADNLGNVPISTTGVIHPSWRIIGSSAGSGIRFWQAIVYPNTLEIVYQGGQLYYLDRGVVGADPFVSVDFTVELGEGKWVALLEIPEHNELAGMQGGQENEFYHLTQEELLKLRNITNQVSSNRLIDPEGSLIFNSATETVLTDWKFFINNIRHEPQAVTLPVLEPDENFPRDDYFIGLSNGTIAYRPSILDPFGNNFPPDIASDEVILKQVQRNPDQSNSDPVSPPVFQNRPNIATQIFDGSFVAGNPASVGYYTTLQGIGGYSKVLTITIDPVIQINYYAVIEFSGISKNYEKGSLWVQFRIDSSGDIIFNGLKCFGEFDPTKYCLVKTDGTTYTLFVVHDEINSFYRFRPSSQFGSGFRYHYHNLESKVGQLPNGSKHFFGLFNCPFDIDGGSATSVYLNTQIINGGNAQSFIP